jgi:hypothetical protein
MSTPSLKNSGCQYFIRYKASSDFLFTTNSQQIVSYVKSKDVKEDITHFSTTLSRLSDDTIQKIGDFTVVKTNDLAKYISRGL